MRRARHLLDVLAGAAWYLARTFEDVLAHRHRET